MKARVVNASEFKAKCLAYLDDIEERGDSITITRRGRAVAVLGPARKGPWKLPANSWSGRISIHGNIVTSDTARLWDVVRKK